MLSSIFRPRTSRKPSGDSGVSPHGQRKHSRGRADDHDEDGADDDDGDIYDDDDEEEEEVEDDDDGREDEDDEPLLPIFSAEMLDKLPVYNTTHAVRLLVVQRCETTLSWDQLRSPQISQFLVKPVQQQIRASLFSRATLYALISNCLQFQKEGQMNPGSVGISKTRALICELLAMRLLRDYSIRELIDALSYDFYPLQGMAGGPNGAVQGVIRLRNLGAPRISAIEVAIRAQSKRFLAHPLVVQQLESIWAGNIVFHSAADYLHRPPSRQPLFLGQNYGAIPNSTHDSALSQQVHAQSLRRTATLYDPAEASLFKLSRLRVPRYRQLFSTSSFAIMLGLFIAVLIQRSQDITPLEIVFWFWSVGYMLDELVGLTEEGFGLYIMSIWNAFDIGILIMFFAYYTLRLYGIIIPTARKRYTANLAYDVLASTAVLLFPRLFSVLDHYRYFSQLLIAFRMMALDLAAILILIIIACSGFFVAFTVAFSSNEGFTAPRAAYTLFQILMGFTPAAWDIWDNYNVLGKAILTLFLCICHFLIVTILITVLTNSFMAVVQNANEEHQFLFAVNAISMVKSDALFSYIAPTNVIGWLLRPLSYLIPFRKYVKCNRFVIKVTHFPLLWSIFIYEYFILSPRMYEPTDLVERRGRARGKLPAFSMRGPNDVFTPPARLREPSVATFRKDRALDEVFRRPYRAETPSRTNLSERKQNVMHDWMRGMDAQGGASPPAEQAQSVVDRLEESRPTLRRSKTGESRYGRRNMRLLTKSVASDPEDLLSTMRRPPKPIQEEDEDEDDDDGEDGGDEGGDITTDSRDDFDADSHQQNLYSDDITPEDQPGSSHADTVDDREHEREDGGRRGTIGEASYFGRSPQVSPRASRPHSRRQSGDLLSSSQPRRQPFIERSLNDSTRPQANVRPGSGRFHQRTISTNTILYSPLEDDPPVPRPSPPKRQSTSQRYPQNSTSNDSPRSRSRSPHKGTSSGPTTAKLSGGTATPGRAATTGAKNIKAITGASKPRPILPPRGFHSQTAPDINLAGFLALDRARDRKPSFNAMALDLASDLGDNVYRPGAGAVFSGLPASFSTALERAQLRDSKHAFPRAGPSRGRTRTGEATRFNSGFTRPDGTDDENKQPYNQHQDAETSRRMSRIMLARMSTLEQGFRDVLQEMRDWRAEGVGSYRVPGVRTTPATAPGSARAESLVDEDLFRRSSDQPLGSIKQARINIGHLETPIDQLVPDDAATWGESYPVGASEGVQGFDFGAIQSRQEDENTLPLSTSSI